MHRRLLTLTRDTRLPLLLTILSGLLAGLLDDRPGLPRQQYVINGVFLEGQTLAQVFDWLTS